MSVQAIFSCASSESVEAATVKMEENTSHSPTGPCNSLPLSVSQLITFSLLARPLPAVFSLPIQALFSCKSTGWNSKAKTNGGIYIGMSTSN